MQTPQSNTARPASPVPGMRIAQASVPNVCWLPWAVVTRAHGFHVSRESAAGGRHETLNNEVGRTKIFRSRPLAEKACAAANFDATATALKAEPLLGGKGGAS